MSIRNPVKKTAVPLIYSVSVHRACNASSVLFPFNQSFWGDGGGGGGGDHSGTPI